jgi:hypothetical protein
MNKKAILGLASGASGHNAAKPSGLGRRVDGTFARWKLVFLSGEASVGGNPLADSTVVGNGGWSAEDSAEGIVTA